MKNNARIAASDGEVGWEREREVALAGAEWAEYGFIAELGLLSNMLS